MADSKISFSAEGVNELKSSFEQVSKMIRSLGQEADESINPFGSLADLGKFSGNIQALRSKLLEERVKLESDILASLKSKYSERERELKEQYASRINELREMSKRGELSPSEQKTEIRSLREQREHELSKEKEDLIAKTQALSSGNLEALQEKERQTLEENSKRLSQLTDVLKQVASQNRRVREGLASVESVAGGQDGVRRLGYLEQLQLRETQLRNQQFTATTESEALKATKELRAVQQQINDITRGSQVSQNRGGVAFSGFGSAASDIARAAASGIGGSAGGVVGSGLNVGRYLTSSLAAPTIMSALGGVALTGGLATAAILGLTLPQAQPLIASETRLRNLTGLRGIDNAFGFTDLGLTATEANQFAAQLALSQGSRRNLASATRGVLSLERGLGLEQGGSLDLVQAVRFDSEARKDLTKNIGVLAKTFEKAGLVNISDERRFDATRFSELQSQTASILRAQQATLGGVNVREASTLVAALQGQGGTLAGEGGLNVLGQVSSSIQAPRGDFARARLFRAILERNPNITLDELQERLEQGATIENIQDVVSFERDVSGGDEATLIRNVSGLFGLSRAQARDFLSASQNLDISATDEETRKTINALAFRATAAGGGTPRTQQKLAELDNFLADIGKGADESINDAIDRIKEIVKGFLPESQKSKEVTPQLQSTAAATAPAGGAAQGVYAAQAFAEIGVPALKKLFTELFFDNGINLSADSIKQISDAIKTEPITPPQSK